MRLSSEECPVCEGVNSRGELQESGDDLIGKFECPDCDTEFEITWSKQNPETVKEGNLSEEDEK